MKSGTLEEIEKYPLPKSKKLNFLVNFKCKVCGKDFTKKYRSFLRKENKYSAAICRTCISKDLHKNLSEESKENRKKNFQKTCLEKYGSTSYLGTSDCVKKSKQTKKKKYGDENYNNQKKSKQTCLERYGVETFTSSEVFKEKSKNTFQEKYGVDNFMETENFLQVSKETCLERYGVDNFAKSEFFNPHKGHTYDSEWFDSKPELEFYKKCKKEGKSIIRRPCRFSYTYKGKKHFYFPDFKVDGILIELKGKQYLKEDGTWKCPEFYSWPSGCISQSEADECYEAKRQCAIYNGVKIIYV